MVHHKKNSNTVYKHEDKFYMRTSPVLSWRLDPDESLSDWTIAVVSSPDLEEKGPKQVDVHDDGNEEYCATRRTSKQPRGGDLSSSSAVNELPLTKIYFVHRTQLAVGPRKSEFFYNLFKREQSKSQVQHQQSRGDCESTDSTSPDKPRTNYTKIELIPAAASCFPLMLDYLYSKDGTPLAIKTESAVALRQLASTFGIRSMFKETTTFIKDDLKPETATTYLLEAKKFKNKKLQVSAMEIIASSFLTIKFSSLVRLSTDILTQVIQSGNLKVGDEARFSSRIAAYCRCREDELNLGILNGYTNRSILSNVDDSESIYFLHLLFDLKEKEGNTKNIESMNLFQLCMLKVPKVLGSLHIPRLIKASSGGGIRKQKKDLELYNDLPAEIKVQLLERSFETSQAPTPEKYAKHQPDIDRRAQKQVDKLQKEVDDLKLSYDKKVHYYQRMLEAKVEELKRISDCSDDLRTH